MANIINAILAVDAEKVLYEIPDNAHKCIMEALDYGFKLHCIAKRLLAASIIRNEEFELACSTLEDDVNGHVLRDIVDMVKSYETHSVNNSVLETHEDNNPAMRMFVIEQKEQESVKEEAINHLKWMENFACVLSTDYMLEDDVYDHFVDAIDKVKAAISTC